MPRGLSGVVPGERIQDEEDRPVTRRGASASSPPQQEVYRQAMRAFAAELGGSYSDEPLPPFIDPHAPALAVHAAALLTVLSPGGHRSVRTRLSRAPGPRSRTTALARRRYGRLRRKTRSNKPSATRRRNDLATIRSTTPRSSHWQSGTGLA
jgi:hypothetical protein